MARLQDIQRELADEGTVYCGKCLKACEMKSRDCGYGAHEYCGSFGIHSDVHLLSRCCGSYDLLLASDLSEEELEVAHA